MDTIKVDTLDKAITEPSALNQKLTSPLLTLPAELRIRIIEHVLPPPPQEYKMCRMARRNYENHGRRHRRKRCPGIVRVNKQMYKESIGFFHKITEFVFTSVQCLKLFMQHLGGEKASLVTKLSISSEIGHRDLMFRDCRPKSVLLQFVLSKPLLPQFVSSVRRGCVFLSNPTWSHVLNYVSGNQDDFILSTRKISDGTDATSEQESLDEDEQYITITGDVLSSSDLDNIWFQRNLTFISNHDYGQNLVGSGCIDY